MIQVTGQLVTPLNEPVAETGIRIISLNNTVVLLGSEGTVTTSSDGTYNFSLVNGEYKVEVLYNDEYIHAGTVTVTDTTNTPVDLPTLLAGE